MIAKQENFLESKSPKHDRAVGSLGFSFGSEQPINLGQLTDWLRYLSSEYSENLFRYKGVLNVMGDDRKFIFQGVHMLMQGEFAGPWGDAERKSCFCFIGKELKKMKILENFGGCIVVEPLRFKVGDKVIARCGDWWFRGIIEEIWSEGIAYGVRRLSDNRMVDFRHDNDNNVRAEGTYDDITISDGKRSLVEAGLEGKDGEASKRVKGGCDDAGHDHHHHDHKHDHKHGHN